ncbi:hypothetical protein [Fischerella sp. PCC 9605]|uniref:hypothetical protein n=1 Tax=Fischerella sp. PCC 9605 TaxID=1173024 RepID=UPI0012DDB0AB|nr:hypothetical protein [Fischerella sp. PCC 9605]
MFWKFVVSALVLPISLGLEVATASVKDEVHIPSSIQTSILSPEEADTAELKQTIHSQDYKISQHRRHYHRTRYHRRHPHYRQRYYRRHYQRTRYHKRHPHYRQHYYRRHYYRPHYQRVYYPNYRYYHPNYRRVFRHGVDFPQTNFYYRRYDHHR